MIKLNGTLGSLTLCLAVTVGILGCNTFKGAGKDIQRGGEAVENAAGKAQRSSNNYSSPRHIITAESASGGAISPAGKSTFAPGATSTYTVNATPGYHIADVLVDGKSVGAVHRHTFENLSQNHVISAKFTRDPAR